MGLTESLAQFAARTKKEGIPPGVLKAAKRHFIDTLGVALGASKSAIAGILSKVVARREGGESSLWDGSGRAGAAEAAWVNGTLAHALDFDDGGVALTPMHPSSPVLPAVFALAEARALSGMDALCAYVVGVEVECKLANLASLRHYERGWHATSVLGALGSTAASSSLLNLAPERICHALGMAASMAGGLRANFGSMTKPLHAGEAARNGLLAALLAEKGFTANPAILEAENGFAHVFDLGESMARAEISDRLGKPFHLLSPGIAIKRFPSCTATHLCLEALFELRKLHRFLPDQIEKVECGLHELDFGVLVRPAKIETPEEARFSLEYVMAAAILDGELSLRHFTEASIQRENIQALMRRIGVYVPPELQGPESRKNRFGLVKIHLRDGSLVSRRATKIRGHPPHLLSDEEVDRKFLDCVIPVLGSEKAGTLLASLHELEKARHVGELFLPLSEL